LRTFCIRRAHRIFPLAYLKLAVAALLGVDAVRENWPWYATYASNHLAAAKGWSDASVVHFWRTSRYFEPWLRFPAEHGLPHLACVGAVTGAVASMSWALFERPFTDLKRRFAYVRQSRGTGRGAPALSPQPE